MQEFSTKTGVTAAGPYEIKPGGIYKMYPEGLVLIHHFTAEEQSMYSKSTTISLASDGTLTFRMESQ